MANKKNILSLIPAIVLLALAMISCRDPLGAEDNVIKNKYATDTVVKYNNITIHDTLVIEKITIKDSIIVKRDTIYMSKDTTSNKRKIKNIEIDWWDSYQDKNGNTPKGFPRIINYKIVTKNGYVDLSKNVPIIDLDLELINNFPEFDIGSFHRIEAVQSLKLIIKDFIPYVNVLSFENMVNRGYWAECNMLDKYGSTRVANCLNYDFYIPLADCSNNRITFVIVGNFEDTNIGTYFTQANVYLELE